MAQCGGAGESAFFVAEEFGFEQVARDRRGVDGDEGRVLARAVAVQRARHQFLAGAGFAVDQHRGVGGGQAADGAEDFLQGSALAEDLGHGADFLVCTIVVRRLRNRPAHQFHGLVDVEGLGQVFESAALEGRHGGIEVGIGGHDDHRQLGMALLHMAQQVEAVAARHADVRHQHLRLLAAVERRQRVVGGAEGFRGNVLPAERLFQHPADGAVVVDDPDRIHGLPPGRPKADPPNACERSEPWSPLLAEKGPGDVSFIILPSSFVSAAASAKSRYARGAMRLRWYRRAAG